MSARFKFTAAANYSGETIHEGGTLTIAATSHQQTIRLDHGFTTLGTAFDAVDVFCIRNDVPLRDTVGLSEVIFQALSIARKSFHATNGLPDWPVTVEAASHVMDS